MGEGIEMSIRGLILDYGEVLSLPQPADALPGMAAAAQAAAQPFADAVLALSRRLRSRDAGNGCTGSSVLADARGVPAGRRHPAAGRAGRPVVDRLSRRGLDARRAAAGGRSSHGRVVERRAGDHGGHRARARDQHEVRHGGRLVQGRLRRSPTPGSSADTRSPWRGHSGCRCSSTTAGEPRWRARMACERCISRTPCRRFAGSTLRADTSVRIGLNRSS